MEEFVRSLIGLLLPLYVLAGLVLVARRPSPETGRSWPEAVALGAGWWGALVAVSTEALGAFEFLTAEAVWLVWLGAALVVALLLRSRVEGRSRLPARGVRRGSLQHRTLLLVLAALAVVAGGAGAARGRMGRDSGMFLYTAWRMLEGDVPYRDVWDHKPPLIYFLNVAAQVLMADSLLGLWLVEVLAVAAAALIGYLALRRATSPLAAGVASLAWLGALVLVLDGGNLAEEYALPLQFACIALLAGWSDERSWGWRAVLLGATGSLAFLLKPNLLGLWLAVVLLRAGITWERREVGPLLRDLGLFVAGAVVPAGLVAVYLISKGALGAYWDAVMVYNVVTYLPAGLRRHAVSLYRGFRLLLPSGVLLAAGIGWLALGAQAARKGVRWLTARPLRGLALLGLPLEFLLTNVDGLPHYYMTWLPASALLVAFLVHEVQARFPAGRAGWPARVGRLVPPLLLVGMGAVPAGRLAAQLRGLPSPPEFGRVAAPSEAIQALDRGLPSGESLLIWGAEARIHFLLRRPSPTRFVYQYSLYNAQYQRPDLVAEFLDDLRRRPPAAVVDTSTTNAEVPPLDRAARAGWSPGPYSYGMAGLEALEPVFSYLDENYHSGGRVNPLGWRLYLPGAGE